MEVKVRFAPSPTGYLHVGGLRTALFNYLYAKKVGGKIVLRIEDTDQTRKVKNAVERLLSTFDSLNIQFDEGPVQGGDRGPYYQSERLYIYREYIEILLNNGNAYPCFCSPDRLVEVREQQINAKQIIKYDRHCLKLDFNEPDYPMTVQDQIALDNHRLGLNLISEAELMVEYNSDLTLEEAEKKVGENKQKNKKQSIFSQAREEVDTTEGLQAEPTEEQQD